MTLAGSGRMTGICGMRNGAGRRPPGSSAGSGCGWKPPGGPPAATRSIRSRTISGSRITRTATPGARTSCSGNGTPKRSSCLWRPASGHCPSQPPPSTRVWTASSPGGPAWTSSPARRERRGLREPLRHRQPSRRTVGHCRPIDPGARQVDALPAPGPVALRVPHPDRDSPGGPIMTELPGQLADPAGTCAPQTRTRGRIEAHACPARQSLRELPDAGREGAGAADTWGALPRFDEPRPDAPDAVTACGLPIRAPRRSVRCTAGPVPPARRGQPGTGSRAARRLRVVSSASGTSMPPTPTGAGGSTTAGAAPGRCRPWEVAFGHAGQGSFQV